MSRVTHSEPGLPMVTFDVVNIRSSRHYFSCQGTGTSLILKESPIDVTQTRPLSSLANLNV